MKEDNIKVSFSGQNLDILYNFEATTSLGLNRGAIVNFVRRFFMSEMYFSTLQKGASKSIMVQIIAKMFLVGYCLMRKSWHYRLPKNKNELFYNFTHNADLTVFSSTKDVIREEDYSYIFEESEGLRAALIRSRIEESITSGAPMSIINAGIINGVKVILPYSSELLIPFFMNLRATAKDIFNPKKIIHEIVNTKLGMLTKHDIIPKGNLPDYHFWAKNIFPKTKLGKSISSIADGFSANMPTSALKLSYELSTAWKNHVMDTIEDKRI